MAVEYRAYEIGPDSHVITRIDLVCADEEDAKIRAQHLAKRHLVELWQGKRPVGRFQPKRRGKRSPQSAWANNRTSTPGQLGVSGLSHHRGYAPGGRYFSRMAAVPR